MRLKNSSTRRIGWYKTNLRHTKARCVYWGRHLTFTASVLLPDSAHITSVIFEGYPWRQILTFPVFWKPPRLVTIGGQNGDGGTVLLYWAQVSSQVLQIVEFKHMQWQPAICCVGVMVSQKIANLSTVFNGLQVRFLHTAFFANVAELVNAPVLKTGSSRKGLVGSNPTISVHEALI